VSCGVYERALGVLALSDSSAVAEDVYVRITHSCALSFEQAVERFSPDHEPASSSSNKCDYSYYW
jgi:hypothetical protein